jgi:hypothetical protein
VSVNLLTMFAGIAWDPHIRGVLVVAVGVSVLMGSVYLLLATNVGARLGLLLSLAGLSGFLVILTAIWWLVPPGIGPRGTNPSWKPVEIYVNDPRDPEPPRTKELAKLPLPQDLPAADRILAEHPEVAEDFPNGATLSDLQNSHPELLSAYLDKEALGGWRLVSSASAGEAQAAADAALKAANFYSSPTAYKKLDTFEYGGKPSLAQECPDAKGGSFLPDDPLCRIWLKIRNSLTLKHPTHFAVVQVQAVIPQEPRPGEPPPLPVVDRNAPIVSVVLVRDLGNVRLIPFLYFVISLALFVFFVLVLHYRDKTLQQNLEAAKGA